MLSINERYKDHPVVQLTVECVCCIVCNQINTLYFNFVLLQIESHTIAKSTKFVFLPKATRKQCKKTLRVVRNLPLRYSRNMHYFISFFFSVSANVKICISSISGIPIKDIQLSINFVIIFLNLCFPNINILMCKILMCQFQVYFSFSDTWGTKGLTESQ